MSFCGWLGCTMGKDRAVTECGTFLSSASMLHHLEAIMHPLDGAGIGEATFNIWDPTTNNSYTQDLGVSFATLQSNLGNTAYSLSFAIDSAVYSSAFSSSDAANLIWSVSVADGLALDYSNYEKLLSQYSGQPVSRNRRSRYGILFNHYF